VYLPPSDADALLQWAAGNRRNTAEATATTPTNEEEGVAKALGPSLFAAFEMVYPSDAFGEMMVR